MSDPSLPLQDAVLTVLKANSDVSAIVGARVYDSVPKSALPDFPYVTLGPLQVLPDKADCIDGTECFMQVDAWSQKNGFPEVKQLGAAIIAALDDIEPTVVGYNCVVFEIQSANYVRDPDGLTSHGAITFHARLQAA